MRGQSCVQPCLPLSLLRPRFLPFALSTVPIRAGIRARLFPGPCPRTCPRIYRRIWSKMKRLFGLYEARNRECSASEFRWSSAMISFVFCCSITRNKIVQINDVRIFSISDVSPFVTSSILPSFRFYFIRN